MTRPRSPEDLQLTSALELGWQVAYLYALADDQFGPPSDLDTLLPLHQSLRPEDQLELQVRTAAGDARRAGIAECATALESLVPQARAAAESTGGCAEFQAALRECHIEIDKELWATCEAEAKAYELGNGLSDTYNRVCRAYRDPNADLAEEWRTVFRVERIQRLKDCLHDLQSRLDPCAVTVVSNHLDAFVERVSEPGRLDPPAVEGVRLLLRRQTVIWRQLLAGDKEPEAFLDRDQRGALRSDMVKLVWKRYRPWLPLVVLAVAALLVAAGNFDYLSRWYQHNPLTTGVATLLVAVAGALGITLTSIALTVRTRVSEWTELLWNRAVALRVADVTLIVDGLLPAPPVRGVVQTARRAGRRVSVTTKQARGGVSAGRLPAGLEKLRSAGK